MEILTKLYLILEAYQNISGFSDEWQYSLKSLIGWSQSPKELLQDNTAELVDDKWMVIGQETETDEDLIIQRNWLKGVTTDRAALILNFGTRFSPLDISIIPGSIIQAKLAFFQSIWKNRAVIKFQKGILEQLPEPPKFLSNISDLIQYQSEIISEYPYATDIPFWIDGVCLTKWKNEFVACDQNRHYVPIIPNFNTEKLIQWKILSNGAFTPLAGVLRKGKILPLGLFLNENYLLL